ncbi:MAG: hypothetical protein Q9228_007507, partial [Teloschistes exilis]
MTDILGTHDDVQDPMRLRSLDSTNGIDNVDHQKSTQNSPDDRKTMKDDGCGGDGAGIISKGKPTRPSNEDVDRSKTDKAENERRKQNGHIPSQEENGHPPETETKKGPKEKILKLTREQIHELTSSPDSLPLAASAIDARITLDLAQDVRGSPRGRKSSQPSETLPSSAKSHRRGSQETPSRTQQHRDRWDRMNVFATPASTGETNGDTSERKQSGVESFPSLSRRNSSKVSLQHNNTTSSRRNSKSTPKPLHLEGVRLGPSHAINQDMPSPMPQTIPIPPYSLPTYLQLELSSHKPSPLYIHRSITSDFPYESSRVKIERLQNFLKVPPKLEGALWFGFFACLDAWLFSFTILPLRFIKAVVMVVQSVARNVWSELKFIGLSLYYGPARLWQRRRASSATSPTRPSFPNIALPTPQNSLSQNPSPKSPQFSFPTENDSSQADHARLDPPRKRRKDQRKHRRAKSMPSELGPCNKADIVTGFLILTSCVILMQFDASRMYHGIRGQAAIKLYVIYNVLEVCDRLFSALGQDILECLISKETLERRPDGRSKIWRPFWLFILALLYNLVHSTALFYQVITLNVAVNSYSNALLTLLMSNQFVEIKSTVFKKFEKENLFQLTCADIVERFQLWLMLTIIALRNLVETGGLSLNFSSSRASSPSSPPTLPSILPKVFTMFPDWTGYLVHLLPFLIVLGSEMLVDWLKHCYITKFNNTKPAIYSRFHDILAKDYYSNAFADQNLTRRLGLPVIPLSCLFIRASVQTYHMFVATYLPPPVASTATSLVSS